MNEIKIVIEGLKELTESVKMLAAAVGAQPADMSGQAGIPVQTQYQQPVQPVPNAVQVPLNYGQTPVQTVPTTAAVPGYTLEQLQVAAAGLTGSGKTPQVIGILQLFGIQAMTELPKERYGEFAAALREAGAQI